VFENVEGSDHVEGLIGERKCEHTGTDAHAGDEPTRVHVQGYALSAPLHPADARTVGAPDVEHKCRLPHVGLQRRLQ
jgi:hypothetical protein